MFGGKEMKKLFKNGDFCMVVFLILMLIEGILIPTHVVPYSALMVSIGIGIPMAIYKNWGTWDE